MKFCRKYWKSDDNAFFCRKVLSSKFGIKKDSAYNLIKAIKKEILL